MIEQRVLIGSPVYDGKSYCLEAWLENLSRIRSEQADVLLVDNSPTEDYVAHIHRLAPWAKIERVIPTGNPYNDVLKSRKRMIEQMKQGGYSHFFSLECDIFPEPDVLDALLQTGLEVVGVPYILSYVIDERTRLKKDYIYSCSSLRHFNVIAGQPTGSVQMTGEELRNAPGILQVYHTGLGCALIAANIYNRVKLRCEPEQRRFDDSLFFQDLKSMNIPVHAAWFLAHKVRHYPSFSKVVGWQNE